MHKPYPVTAYMPILTNGMETSTVDMMPIKAYASAQKGSASGSLQGQEVQSVMTLSRKCRSDRH